MNKSASIVPVYLILLAPGMFIIYQYFHVRQNWLAEKLETPNLLVEATAWPEDPYKAHRIVIAGDESLVS